MDFENLLTACLDRQVDCAMGEIEYTDDRQALLYGIPYRTEIVDGGPMKMALYTQSAALADIFSASLNEYQKDGTYDSLEGRYFRGPDTV